jgi:predicted chitinase
MADEINPNIELTEAVNRLNDTLGHDMQMRMSMLKKEDAAKFEDIRQQSVAFGTLQKSTSGLTRAQQEAIESAKEYNKVMENYAAALQNGVAATKKLFNNLVSQDPSRSFTKYSDGIEQMTGAMGKALGNFGMLGKAIGGTIEAAGKLASIYTQQADNLLKANDAIAQFGTAGSFTTKQLMEMAHGAGLTSKNMDLLVKPIQSLGPALTNLGGTTGEGVKAFADLTKITNKQREEYQRMGISQEQLIQNQADYIALQRTSGRSISNELKDRNALQKASLEYTDNLLALSAITGENVESIKKQQKEALAATNFQISQVKLENEARRLAAAGDKEGAEAKRNEAKARNDFLANISSLGDAQLTAAMQARLATGTWTDQNAHMARLGIPMEKFEAAIKKGGDMTAVTGEFMNTYNKKLGQAVDAVGGAAVHSEETQKLFGMNRRSMENFNANRDKDMTEELKKAKAARDKASKPGADPAQDARAKMTTLEIEAGKAFDKLIASGNVLVSGFGAGTIAVGLLTAAAYAAAGALAAVAGKSILQSGADALKDALGKAGGAKGGPRGPGPAPGPSGPTTRGGRALDPTKGFDRAARLERVAAGRAAQAATGTAAPTVARAAATAAPAAATAAPVAATAVGTAGTAGAGGAATAATTAGSALSKLAGPLAGFAKAAPLIGAALSVGTAAVDTYQGLKEVDKKQKAGELTKEEARVEKGEVVGGGVGTAAGGAGGAWAGAAAGAAIGSAVPVVGTIIGGIMGAALGGWMGSKGGEAIGKVAGGSIAKMTDSADKKVDEAAKKADAKKDEKEAKTETPLGKKDEIVKVSIISPLPLPVAIVKSLEPLVKMAGTSDNKPEFIKTSAVLSTDRKEIPKAQFVKPVVENKEVPVAKEKTPAFGAGTFTGMAMGALLGPIGMLVGGLIGSRFNKPESVKEPGVKDIAKPVAGEGQPKRAKSIEFTFSEMELAKKDEKLYKEYSDRKKELYEKELKALGDNAIYGKQAAMSKAKSQAEQEFAERAAKVGAAKITKTEEAIKPVAKTPEVPVAKTPEVPVAKTPEVPEVPVAKAPEVPGAKIPEVPVAKAPESFTFSENELAKKDEKLYKAYLDRKKELYEKELKAWGDDSRFGKRAAMSKAKTQAEQEFAERAEKVGAAKITKPVETTETPIKAVKVATKLPAAETLETPKVPAVVAKTPDATVKETKKAESFTFSEFELAKRDEKLYKEYLDRKKEIYEKELKDLGDKKSVGSKQVAMAKADLQVKQEFLARANKIGAATIDSVAEQPKGKVTPIAPPESAPKFTVQKGFEPKAVTPAEGGMGSAAKQILDMMDSSLPKSIAQPKLGEQEDHAQSGSQLENLLDVSASLTDQFARLSSYLEDSNDVLSGMTNTFGSFDMKLKKDLTRNIPQEVGDSMTDALKAGMGDASRLREQLREPPAGGGGALPPPGAAAPPVPAMPSGAGPAVDQDVKQNLGDIKSALMQKGMGDESYLNAVLGNVMKESGGKVVNENLDYSKTSNERIKHVFGQRASGKTDQELNQIKSNPQSMGEFMYGKDTDIGRRMGNVEPGDGWKFRGRGYIQLTGKTNYAEASKAIFGDDRLVKDPDMVNDPKVAANVVSWYMQRTKGAMQKQLGMASGPMSQSQANLLATSQIAGHAITRGAGYTGGEVLNKVDSYSQQVAGIQPTGGGAAPVTASSGKSSSGTESFAKGPSDMGSTGPVGDVSKSLVFAGRSGTLETFKGLDSGIQKAVASAAEEYQKNTGRKIQVNSAKRDSADQKRLWDESERAGRPGRGPAGMAIARPGTSKHERGAAIDIQQFSDPTAVGLMNKYGMKQTVPGDPVHFELKARTGGMFDGPDSGYPVEMHGGELVTPLEPRSVLAKLATTPADGAPTDASAATSTITSPSSSNEAIERMISLNLDTMNMLSTRLDIVVRTLETSNGIQEKILQYSKV